VLAADRADSAQVLNAGTKVQQKLGSIDVWVKNAVVTVFFGVRRDHPDEFRRATEMTYLDTQFQVRWLS
jgi:hypothetical protein